MAPEYLGIGEVARRLGCRPRDISDAFYGQHLDAALCPIVSGRRCVPPSYVATVRRVLRQLGKLPEKPGKRNP
jgi:hypothetical protein